MKYDPHILFLAGIMGGLLGLVYWSIRRMHVEAMGKMDEIVKANHSTALLVERHDVKIETNTKSVDAIHKRLDQKCAI